MVARGCMMWSVDSLTSCLDVSWSRLPTEPSTPNKFKQDIKSTLSALIFSVSEILTASVAICCWIQCMWVLLCQIFIVYDWIRKWQVLEEDAYSSAKITFHWPSHTVNKDLFHLFLSSKNRCSWFLMSQKLNWSWWTKCCQFGAWSFSLYLGIIMEFVLVFYVWKNRFILSKSCHNILDVMSPTITPKVPRENHSILFIVQHWVWLECNQTSCGTLIQMNSKHINEIQALR